MALVAIPLGLISIAFLLCSNNLIESLPVYSASGKVASCTYSWLDNSTTITFSGQSPITVNGNYNLQVGSTYKITYQQALGGYTLLNLELVSS
jgi:hypothetical protein